MAISMASGSRYLLQLNRQYSVIGFGVTGFSRRAGNMGDGLHGHDRA